MLFDYISTVCGIIKICIFRLFNCNRIYWETIPKMNNSFKIAIKKGATLKLGKGLRSRNNVSFRIYDTGKVSIGDNCFFNDGCSINCQKEIFIGNNVIFGQNTMVFDHDHDYKHDMNKFIKDEIIIGNNVWIGANVLILKGVTIGDNCVIAAGTIVKENIESNSMLYQERKSIIKKVQKWQK